MSNEDEAKSFVEGIEGMAHVFDELCQQRHLVGQKEYGAFTFLGNDVVAMMIEELADTVNYCRMQAIKLMILQQGVVSQIGEQAIPIDTMGMESFKGAKDMGWN
jgi:hypothetical protein